MTSSSDLKRRNVELQEKVNDLTNALVRCLIVITGEAVGIYADRGGVEQAVRDAKRAAKEALRNQPGAIKKIRDDISIPEKYRILDTGEAAAMLGITRNTLLKRIREKRDHPKFFNRGNKLAFRIGDVQDHIEKQTSRRSPKREMTEKQREAHNAKMSKMAKARWEAKRKINKEVMESYARKLGSGSDTGAISLKYEDFAPFEDE